MSSTQGSTGSSWIDSSPASVVYPTDYGYVAETLALDGDPLDVLVCVSEGTFPGCAVLERPDRVVRDER